MTKKMKTRPRDRKRTGPIERPHKEFVFNSLCEIIENGEILGATQTQLAKKFGIKRQTISRYLHEIYSSIPPEDLNVVRVQIQKMFGKIFREAQHMIVEAENVKEKKEAISLMLLLIEKFTMFLESFHLKQKAVENISIETEKQLVVVRNQPVVEVKKIEKNNKSGEFSL